MVPNYIKNEKDIENSSSQITVQIGAVEQSDKQDACMQADKLQTTNEVFA